MGQQQIRFTDEQLIALFGEKKHEEAMQMLRLFQKGHPQTEWILVPKMQRNMISIVSATEFDKGQNGVCNIIHDHLHKAYES